MRACLGVAISAVFLVGAALAPAADRLPTLSVRQVVIAYADASDPDTPLDDGKPVAVGYVDETSLAAYRRADDAADLEGAARIAEGPGAIRLAVGTKLKVAKVIRSRTNPSSPVRTYEVEIIEGKSAGKHAFFAARNVAASMESGDRFAPLYRAERQAARHARMAKAAIPKNRDAGFVVSKDHRPGGRHIIHGDNGLPVYGADGIFAYTEMVKFIHASDGKGLADLIAEKKVFRLEDESETRLIEIKDYVTPKAAEIRILSGAHADRLLWVHTAVLHSRR